MTSHIMTSRWSTCLTLAGFCISCAAASRPAEAQPLNPSVTADDRSGKAQAESDRADELFNEGKYKEACPLYKAAQDKDPTVRGLLDLGTCYERLGRINTAWNYFVSCVNAARGFAQSTTDPERKKKLELRAVEAQSKADALDKRRPKLKVVVEGPAELAGLSVRVDEESWERARWGQPLPIDPGEHTIKAEAPGRQPWSATFHIQLKKEGEPAETREVKIPQLEAPPMPRQRVAALVVGGVTVVAGVVGVAFGVPALLKAAEAERMCRADAQTCTDPNARQIGKDGLSLAHVSTASFVIAGAGAVATGILWFTAPSAASIQVSPAAGPTGASLTIRGHF